MASKEYVCMEETPEETQKKIRQWVSTGYKITFMFQQSHITYKGTIVVSSLWREK